MTGTVYTIGHSTHKLEEFIGLLKQQGISMVCDVRSDPYSRANPQFNRETLKAALGENGIIYMFLGKELGARSDDQSCYTNGKVQYDCLAQTAPFRKGIDVLLKKMRTERLVLMCAEKDPLECHRAILIARYLEKLGVSVEHILCDGTKETHRQTEKRLLRLLKLQDSDGLFSTYEAIVDNAYKKQGERIAYTFRTMGEPIQR